MSLFKQLALNWDVRLGTHLPIRHVAYTEETLLKSGRGAYSREEWTLARRTGYNRAGPEAQELDSESSFLRRALGSERRKVLTGLRLADYLSGATCRSVLEIGCGEMISA